MYRNPNLIYDHSIKLFCFICNDSGFGTAESKATKYGKMKYNKIAKENYVYSVM